MSARPLYTPYDGSAGPFQIGLRPLDLKNWLEFDENHLEYLAQKNELLANRHERVFVAQQKTADVQGEVLELVLSHLSERHADRFNIDNARTVASITGSDVSVDLRNSDMPDLEKAARLVQEDLVIMRKREDGWTLVAACVCFPSSWVLVEKFSRPMHEIHGPVPGFEKGTRNATMIERIFDNLLVDMPAERFNWSIYSDDALYHDDRAGEHVRKADLIGTDDGAGENYLRVEHQTLRKLPDSGDILFTIAIHIDPVRVLANRPDRAEIISGFIKSLREMSEKQTQYKGLYGAVEPFITKLEAVAKS